MGNRNKNASSIRLATFQTGINHSLTPFHRDIYMAIFIWHFYQCCPMFDTTVSDLWGCSCQILAGGIRVL